MKRFNYKKIFNTFFNEKNTKKTLFILIPLLIFGVAIAITLSIDLYGTEEVRSVEIDSNDWSEREPGSWHIDKSAEWTGLTTAKVTFDFDSVMKPSEKKYDVIFVLDVSGSMADKEKLKRVKEDSIELVNYLFSWGENRVAFITFTDTAEIISPFTQNKDELIGLIQGLKEAGSTNYKAGLELVDTVMKDYEEETGRKLVTLFLTDGFPNIDTPNEVAEYEYLKQKYPYMSINGVQYEMGTDIVEEIKRISDEQFYADVDNLENVLFDASIYPVQYEKLEIVDYVKLDRFYVKSVDDIKVSFGTVELDEPTQKITWNLDGFKTGRDAHMEITLHLTDKFTEDGHPKEGMYPTNEGEDITHKLPEEPEVETPSKKTPILKAPYLVIYDVNAPSECNIKDKINEKHYAFETVTKRTDAPDVQCSGYQFKGWELDEKESINPEDGGYDVKHLNDDMFVMPQHDVTLRGIWTKVDISKSMDGTVYEKLTLYKKMEKLAESNTDRNSGVLTKNDSSTNNNKIYYYFRQNTTTAAVTDNNVIFAGFCWKIMRTTDTGGVKIIYNGEPNGETCKDVASNNIGTIKYNNVTTTNGMTDSLAYVGYMYNPDTMYSFSTYSDLKGMDSVSGSVMVASSYTENSSGTYTLVNPEEVSSSSISNYRNYYYCSDMKSTTNCSSIKKIYSTSNTNLMYFRGYRYANSFTYNAQTKTYQLVNPSTIFWFTSSSITDFNNYHYTCFDTSKTCSNSINYVFGGRSQGNMAAQAYYIKLENGTKINNVLNSMLYNDDVNKVDSNAKTKVEAWFKDNLTNDGSSDLTKIDYQKYIEDTIYCNDRSASSDGGFNPNGGSITSSFNFSGGKLSYLRLTCPNTVDSFTVSNEIGNGKLKYPVGLATLSEIYLSKSAVSSSSHYWTMTPFSYTNSGTSYVGYSSNMGSISSSSYGLRPVISLVPNIEFTKGDGTEEHPYVIFTEEE